MDGVICLYCYVLSLILGEGQMCRALQKTPSLLQTPRSLGVGKLRLGLLEILITEAAVCVAAVVVFPYL